MSRLVLFVLASLMLARPAAAQDRGAVLDSVASLLRSRYVSADTAELIVGVLRRQQQAGAYRELSDSAFAQAVTRDLRETNGDLHLRLRVAGPQVAPQLPPMVVRAEMLPDSIGVLEFGSMAFPAGEELERVRQALDRMRGARALIIDLRRNGGGAANMNDTLWSYFIREATPAAVITRRDGTRQERTARPRSPESPLASVPLMILTSRRTGSAAEGFLFFLKNIGRARIVGTRSAGAGHIVGPFPAGGGFAVSISVARVTDPRSGLEWERVGVQPDIETDSAAALERALELLRGGAPRARGDDTYPAWSPDGRSIAFTSNRDGNDEIYVMRRDGSALRRLTHHAGADAWPSWSRDGRRIVFDSDRDGNRELYTIGIDGTGLTRVTRAEGAFDAVANWSRASDLIAFDSDRGEDGLADVWVVRPDGSGERALTTRAGSNGHPAWSPDGRAIAFRSGAVVPGRPRLSELFVQPVDGGTERALTALGGSVLAPSWSPDGREIVFAARGDSINDLFVVSVRGGAARRLTRTPALEHRPSFSPSGDEIVYAARDGDRWSLRFVPTRGDPARELLQRVADAMGGLSALEALPPLVTNYHMTERSIGQESWPGGIAAVSVQLGERQVDTRAARERLVMKRHMSGGRLYDRTLDAGLWQPLRGELPGDSSAPVSVESELSAALAALHPETLLPRLLRQPAYTHRIGRELVLHGRRVIPVSTRVGSRPIVAYVDASSDRLLAVEWQDGRGQLFAGTTVQAVFGEYRPASVVSGSPVLPHLIEVRRGNLIWQVRSYAEYRPMSSALADIAGEAPVGETTFADVGTRATHVRGGTNNSLIVDVGDRVVMIDVPETPPRARAAMSFARERAAGRPVSVVVTHLHEDHVGGLAGLGADELIVDHRNVDRLRQLMRLADPRARPSVRAVRDSARLGTAADELLLMAIPHSHAEGMLVGYLPAERTLFEADLLRGLLPHSTAELVDWVRNRALPVDSVVSSHGTAVLPWERFETSTREWRAGLRAPGSR